MHNHEQDYSAKAAMQAATNMSRATSGHLIGQTAPSDKAGLRQLLENLEQMQLNAADYIDQLENLTVGIVGKFPTNPIMDQPKEIHKENLRDHAAFIVYRQGIMIQRIEEIVSALRRGM